VVRRTQDQLQASAELRQTVEKLNGTFAQLAKVSAGLTGMLRAAG